MKTIGAVLAFACLILFSVPALPVLYVAGRFSPETAGRWSQAVIRAGCHAVLAGAGARVRVSGEENIPRDEAVLFVSNHRSLFDALLLYGYTPVRLGVIAKKETMRIPFIRRYMQMMGCTFLDRSDLRQGLQVILDSIASIKKGLSMWIFPEGTRTRDCSVLEMLPFHEGSFKIATKAGAPVVPVSITGTGEMIARKPVPHIRGRLVTLRFGTPVRAAELDEQDRRHIGAYTREIILEMLKEDTAGEGAAGK